MKRLLGLVLVTALIVLLTACGKGIELSETFEVSYRGNNGEGTVMLAPDIAAIGQQLNLKANSESDQKLMAGLLELMTTMKYSAAPNQKLSNGQEIEITCTWDEEVAKKYGLKPSMKKKTLTIPEDAFRVIHAVTEAEAFEAVAVVTTGIYPNLEVGVQYEKTNDITRLINLSVESVDFEKNVVVVRASMPDYAQEANALSLESMTKEIPLGEYSRYISDLKELDDANRKRIFEQAKNTVVAHLEKDKTSSGFFSYLFPYASDDAQKSARKFDDPKLSKVYFLELKPNMRPNGRIYNQAVIIYETKLYHHQKPEGVSLFLPLLLDNIVKLSNGEFDYQLGAIQLYTAQIKNSDADYKSLFVNQHIDRYKGIEYDSKEFAN